MSPGFLDREHGRILLAHPCACPCLLHDLERSTRSQPRRRSPDLVSRSVLPTFGGEATDTDRRSAERAGDGDQGRRSPRGGDVATGELAPCEVRDLRPSVVWASALYADRRRAGGAGDGFSGHRTSGKVTRAPLKESARRRVTPVQDGQGGSGFGDQRVTTRVAVTWSEGT